MTPLVPRWPPEASDVRYDAGNISQRLSWVIGPDTYINVAWWPWIFSNGGGVFALQGVHERCLTDAFERSLEAWVYMGASPMRARFVTLACGGSIMPYWPTAAQLATLAYMLLASPQPARHATGRDAVAYRHAMRHNYDILRTILTPLT